MPKQQKQIERKKVNRFSDLIITFYLVIISIILIFIFYRFFTENFSKQYLFSKLGIILLIVSVILLIILGIKYKSKENISILLISISFAFYLLESSFILKNYYDEKKSFHEEKINKSKSKKEIYNILKKKEKIVPSFSLNKFFENKPKFGDKELILLTLPSHTKVISCLKNNEWKYYKTDRYGFNNNDEIWNSKNKIFMLGDSFGVGECVNYDDSLAGRISNSLKEYELINLSQTGNGPLLELATFLEYADIFKPKILIWFYFEGNDLLELKNEKKQKLLLKYVNEKNFSQKLSSKQEYIDNYIFDAIEQYSSSIPIKSKLSKQNLYSFFTLSNLRGKVNLFQNNYNSRVIRNIDSLFFRIINQINLNIKNNNGNFYFVYLPTEKNVSDKNYALSKNIIVNFLKKENINLIDAELVFKNQKTIFDPINDHYTAEVYKLISDKVIEIINLDD